MANHAVASTADVDVAITRDTVTNTEIRNTEEITPIQMQWHVVQEMQFPDPEHHRGQRDDYRY